MTKTERIELIVKKLKTRKSKNIIYTLVLLGLVFVFGFRFYSVSQENNFDVFNIARNNIENGLPVDVVVMEKKSGVLLEPITIKNNIAYVSGARIGWFRAGQKIGDCKIVSVSHNIDLDSGMHVIKTTKCKDGLQYVENEKTGFYIPVSAMHGNYVYLMDGDVARIQQVEIENKDAQNALIKSGIKDGDIVILSNVQNGQKVKIVR